MNKVFVFSVLIMLFSIKCYSQEKLKPVSFDYPITDSGQPNTWSDVRLKVIDEAQLIALMKKSKATLKYVVIYSNNCGGSSSVFDYIKSVEERFPNDVDVFVLSTDNYSSSAAIMKFLYNVGYFKQTYIIDKSYGKYLDVRKKGKKFAESFCPASKADIIGVPYNLVFDKNLNVLFHGFRVYNNSLPEDIIGYFLKNL